MSSLSSDSSFESDSSDISLDISDVWEGILGQDWQEKTMLGSGTSITSGLFTTSLSDLVPMSISIRHHSSSSSGYGDDEDSDFASDMLEFLDNTGLISSSEDFAGSHSVTLRGLNPGDCWACLQRWVHQQIEQMYAN
jgi:hypothetical protein